MSVRPSPTVRSKRLRRELRRLREERGLTIEQATDLAGGEWNPSTLGRWENGDRRIRPGDLRVLLDVYDIQGDQREALLTLAKEARQRGWWQSYADVLPSEYGEYIGLEAEASSIRTYQQQLVPGPLQTEDYARAVISAGRPDDAAEAIDRRVAVRLARQAVLTRDEPLRFWAVIDEAVTRRQVGGPEVMRAQLRHLAEIASRPGIQLQILLFTAGAHPAMAASFIILGFPPPDPDVAYVDAGASGLFVEDAAAIAAYRLMFDHLRAAALSPNESAALLAAEAARRGD
jgi:transcriptional regulator with XRE-family HTH domain